jgi:hypothetical protein
MWNKKIFLNVLILEPLSGFTPKSPTIFVLFVWGKEFI